MANVVGDEMLGKIARQQNEWFRRIKEGSLDPEKVLLVHSLLQDFADGKVPDLPGLARGTHEIREIHHIIDLSVPCDLPFPFAERSSPAKFGLVKLELQGDNLLANGQKINLFFPKQRRDGWPNGNYPSGNDLRKVVEARGGGQSAKILDYLQVHPELWPEHWKKDKNGNTIFVYFWGDIFGSHVRYGFWDEGKVKSHYSSLQNIFRANRPAASIK